MARNLGNLPDGAADATGLVDLADAEAPRSLTFAALEAAINHATAQLLEDGLGDGERVAVLGLNSAEYLVTLFAIMRAGGVAVPVNIKQPNDTIGFIVEDCAARWVFSDEPHRDLVTRIEPRCLFQCDAAEATLTVASISGDDAGALVLYTSGSTGRPKGVLLSHASQWFMVDSLADGLAGATAAVAAPLYHMNGLLMSFLLLHGGGQVVLMPRFDARAYLEAIHDYSITTITGVPTMLAMMARETALLDGLDLGCVETVLIGSSPLSETIIETTRRMFPAARLANSYGTTETGTAMFGPHPDGIATPPLSIGYPNPATQVRLAGGDGSEGVLEVRTPAAMTIYLNLAEKTSQKFTADGFVITGDIMRCDSDGFYYFVGRDDDMFVCSGENVYPGAIERVLERDPRIVEACVVPVDDLVRGQMPVAFVTTATDARVDAEAVKAIALESLPGYMHPRYVYILDTMPLAGTNKVDRTALARRAAQDVPGAMPET